MTLFLEATVSHLARPGKAVGSGERISGFVFFFQGEDGIRDDLVTGVQTCALPISPRAAPEQRALDAVIDVERQQQIVLDRLTLEHGRLLEFAADAELDRKSTRL